MTNCILVGHASRSLGNAVPRSRLRGPPSPFSKAPQLSASAWPLQRESLPPRNRVNRFPVLLLYHPGRSIGRRRRYFEQVDTFARAASPLVQASVPPSVRRSAWRRLRRPARAMRWNGLRIGQSPQGIRAYSRRATDRRPRHVSQG